MQPDRAFIRCQSGLRALRDKRGAPILELRGVEGLRNRDGFVASMMISLSLIEEERKSRAR
jgi:hypothetical protein